MHRRGVFCAVIALVIATGVAGCGYQAPRGISLNSSERTLPSCEQTDPVPVAELNGTSHARCDLAGVEIEFPDGFRLSAPGILDHATGGGGAEYPVHSLSNLGVYGVVAALTTGKPLHTEWWGTEDGITKQRDAAGPNDSN